jgi:nucleotide-binding universal stress UspA family protein
MKTTLFRHVLVPHDFSEAADQALQAAADLAAAAGGRLTVLNVVAPTYLISDPMFTASLPPPEAAVPDVRASLEQRVGRVLRKREVPVKVAVQVGHPAETIVDAAASASLVIMATHGRTGVSHLLLGSVAERVVRLSPAPVLTIRPKNRAKSGQKRRK